MGNGLSLSPSCLHLPATSPAAVRLVYWGGQARQLAVTGGDDNASAVVTAGDVAAELPAPAAGYAVVCPADAFFVGLPIPAMSPGEELLPGRTYFVLPAARLPSLKALTPATLAALSYGDGSSNGNGKRRQPLFAISGCPFEHVKGADGSAPLIRVLPEFIEKLISYDAGAGRGGNGSVNAKARDAELCSTPELKRHYAQLVGTGRSRAWSPRLETIAERDRSRWMRSAARTMLSSR